MKYRGIEVPLFVLAAAELALLLASPALYFAHTKATLFLLDYAAIAVPFAIWALLLRLDAGRFGFSRWIVPLLLAIATPLVLTFRVVLLDVLTAAPPLNALLAFALCCALPLAMHRVLPHLPAEHEEDGQ